MLAGLGEVVDVDGLTTSFLERPTDPTSRMTAGRAVHAYFLPRFLPRGEDDDENDYDERESEDDDKGHGDSLNAPRRKGLTDL